MFSPCDLQGYLIFWRGDPTSFARQLHRGELFSNIEDIFKFNRYVDSIHCVT